MSKQLFTVFSLVIQTPQVDNVHQNMQKSFGLLCPYMKHSVNLNASLRALKDCLHSLYLGFQTQLGTAKQLLQELEVYTRVKVPNRNHSPWFEFQGVSPHLNK